MAPSAKALWGRGRLAGALLATCCLAIARAGGQPLAIEPASLGVDLQVGQSAREALRLANQGSEDLDLSLLVSSRDMRYNWARSDEPGGPSFAWRDIDLENPVILNLGDEGVEPIRLPFPFSFYGQAQDSVWVSANGLLSFDPITADTFNPVSLPAPDRLNNLIAAFWMDLNSANGGSVSHLYDPAAERLYVQYSGVPPFIEEGTYTFQIIIEAGGAIFLQYLAMSGPLDPAVIGLENGDGSRGLELAYLDGGYVHDGLAVRLTPWLRMAPVSGTIPPGASMRIDLDLEASRLNGGQYAAVVEVRGGATGALLVDLPVRLGVTGQARLGPVPAALEFNQGGSVSVGTAAVEFLALANEGTDVLEIGDVGIDNGAFLVDQTSFQIEPGDSLLLGLSFAPESAGTTTGTLTFATNDPGAPQIEVRLQGSALHRPEIEIAPQRISADLVAGAMATDTLTIYNRGIGALEFSLAENSPWLAIRPDAGTVAPGDSTQVLLDLLATDLIGDDYTTQLLIASNAPNLSVIAVPILLGVVGQSRLVLQPDILDFGAVPAGGTVELTLEIANEGTAVLALQIVNEGQAILGAIETIFSAAASDFALGSVLGQLQPGQGQLIQLLFAPTVAGPQGVALMVNSGDGHSTPLILRGEGLPRTVFPTPTSLSDTLFGTQSQTQSVTLVNEGDSPWPWRARSSFSGQALRFGDGAHIRVEDDPSLNMEGSFTIEAWINSDGRDGTNYILQKGSQYSLALEPLPDDPDSQLLLFGLGREIGVGVVEGLNLGALFETAAPGTWHHVVGVYKAADGTREIWVDGELAGSDQLETGLSLLTTLEPLYIGQCDTDFIDAHTSFFAGLMDEVRLWKVVRTPEQIRRNRYRVLSGEEPGLVGYWRFDLDDGRFDLDGGEFTLDRSGRANHGVFAAGSNTGVEPVYTDSTPSGWLRLPTAAGAVAANSRADIDVVFSGRGLSSGTYDQTITIEDDSGLFFAVEAHLGVGGFSGEEVLLNVGAPADFDLREIFTEAFTQYSVSSSDPERVAAFVRSDGTTLRVVALDGGDPVTIAVTATDEGGGRRSDSFVVAVNAPPQLNTALPDSAITLDVDNLIIDLEAAPTFSDPEGDALAYQTRSLTPETAAALVVEDGRLVVVPIGGGQALIEVGARDARGGQSPTDTMAVHINRKPALADTIDDLVIAIDGPPSEIALFTLIADADDDDLVYEATSSAPEVVAVKVLNNSILSLIPQLVGQADISLAATDPFGAGVAVNFQVAVSGPPHLELLQPRAEEGLELDLAEEGDSLLVEVALRDDDDLATAAVQLHYRRGGEPDFASRAMAAGSPGTGTFTAFIPSSVSGPRGVEFYLEAQVAEGLTRLPPERVFSVPVRVDAGIESAQLLPARSYRQVSLPLDVFDQNPLSVLLDDLGDLKKSRWRFFATRADSTHAELEQGNDRSPDPLLQMEPGRAFWLIAKGETSLTSGPGTTMRTDRPFEIPLQSVWTFFGPPFNFPIPLANVRLQSGKAPDVVFYEDAWSTVAADDSLKPFEGYAVSIQDSADVLLIDPDRSTAAGKAVAPADRLDWSIRIAAHSGAGRDLDNRAGVAPQGAAGWDAMDRPEPPLIGDYVSLYFPHPQWGLAHSRYRTDIRPQSDGQLWDFEIRARSGAPVELLFSQLEGVPQDLEIWLLDEVATTAQDLRQQATYRVAVAGADRPRPLRLAVGDRAFVEDQGVGADLPATYELAPNFPNPFNPATTIRYALPLAGRASLTVYDALGQVVAVLVDDVEGAAGRHAVVWDGRDRQGRKAANGLYFYRLRAGDFAQVRKMLLLK